MLKMPLLKKMKAQSEQRLFSEVSDFDLPVNIFSTCVIFASLPSLS